MGERPLTQISRVVGVVVVQIILVHLHSGATSTEVEEPRNGCNFTGAQGGAELVAIEVRLKLDAVQISLFAGVIEVVNDDDVRFAPSIELADDVGADESGASCDDKTAHFACVGLENYSWISSPVVGIAPTLPHMIPNRRRLRKG